MAWDVEAGYSAGSEQFSQDLRKVLSSASFLGSLQNLKFGLWAMAVVTQNIGFLHFPRYPPPFLLSTSDLPIRWPILFTADPTAIVFLSC